MPNLEGLYKKLLHRRFRFAGFQRASTDGETTLREYILANPAYGIAIFDILNQ
jgi:hypothetical protein